VIFGYTGSIGFTGSAGLGFTGSTGLGFTTTTGFGITFGVSFGMSASTYQTTSKSTFLHKKRFLLSQGFASHFPSSTNNAHYPTLSLDLSFSKTLAQFPYSNADSSDQRH